MMRKLVIVLSLLAATAILPSIASASERSNALSRIRNATQVFQEIMNTPDQGIPQGLLESASCVAIIPGDVKFAFIFGGNYGRGLAMCRTGKGWSAPVFLAVEGGSVGYQIGGSSTDLVLLFMNGHALRHLLSDKFKLGADASVAAGPVGRHASASTDIAMHAEILSYSRSRGIFAGVSLSGSVVKADQGADEALYGAHVTRQQIIHGQVPMPSSAERLAHKLTQYSKP
jgi:SH3 domain-containing YSC84-like protein 1